MKKLAIIILTASLVFIGLQNRAFAKVVSKNEALQAANNWITLIINKKGDWGGSDTAVVEDIRELKRMGKTIGYFSEVSPRGFIIVSLRKELAPIKAYSSENDLDPDVNKGMANLIKEKMAQIINEIEQRLGPLDTIRSRDLRNILEINYSSAWDELIGSRGEKTPEVFQSDVGLLNYQEGDILLTSSWHQSAPYNDQTPAGATCAHTLVGCVATAGAQIMRHWNWPPYGVGTTYNDTYDWPNMLDRATTASSAAERAAVAELNHEVGVAVGMNYGCDASGAYTYDMEGVYENQYRYSTAAVRRNRNDYTATGWFDRLKLQFNANRPVQYRLVGHSIVGDGWQEIGATPTRQYHMNYGWDDGHNTWWTLDALYLGGIDEEYIIENIYPAQATGSWISGTYAKQSFPYRYFDRDATGYSATFESGQYLQFLPDITVTNTSATGGSFRFEGSGTLNTRLFTRGDTSTGVRIYNGAMKVNQNGSIKFN